VHQRELEGAVLMRGDIERTLCDRVRDNVDIRFGTSVDRVEMADGGVQARLEDGVTIDADLIVGADGLHSKVRALCFGHEEQFVRTLGSRVSAFILERSHFPHLGPDETYSMTEVRRAVALAAIRQDQLVAFFIWRAERERRFGTVESELKHAFAGAGWLVPQLLDHVSQAEAIYFDEVAQVTVSPRWAEGRAVLLGDAGYAVSLIAGKGATLAMAGGVMLADALAEMTGDIDGALARYEARLRPMAESAQAMARRNVNLFTPANRLQLHMREIGMRLATLPPVARLAKRLLNPSGERL
jgi:2-polyprenyl-6-methoxyphenol hydroxylase-like FAD-dependent oxidoreductase